MHDNLLNDLNGLMRILQQTKKYLQNRNSPKQTIEQYSAVNILSKNLLIENTCNALKRTGLNVFTFSFTSQIF